MSTSALLPRHASSSSHALFSGSRGTVTMVECMQQGGFDTEGNQGACTNLNDADR